MPLSEQAITEIQDLAWAMADDAITPEDAKRLESLLLADPEARQLYVECMQLQADLYMFFNPKPLTPPTIPVGPPRSLAPPAPAIQNLPSAGAGNAPAGI
jgi:hypothetical protein